MQRRQFLHALGLAALSSAAPDALAKLTFEQPLFKGTPLTSYLAGYQGQDLSCDAAWIEGTLPDDLRGVFYRNGPALFERGGKRYQHWFDGDGMVHAWRFSDKGVSHRGRFVQTRKWQLESAHGEFMVPGFGTAIRPKGVSLSNEIMNTANTNVIKLNDRLLAMWEGGSTYALDPTTLATHGSVIWDKALAGIPFSAHPKVEANGTLWNFGTFNGKLVLYHIAPSGTLVKHAVLDIPASALVHDFAITHKHLVFLLPPVFTDHDRLMQGQSMVESMVWRPQESVKVLIVEKDDFSQQRMLEMPACMLFHIGNAWEHNQVIHLDFVKYDNIDELQTVIPAMMRGEHVTATPSCPACLTIDLSRGRIEMETRTENVEFPRIDPRLVGLKNQHTFYPYASGPSGAGHLNGLIRIDRDTGKTDTFNFGGACTLEEHVIVPKANQQREDQVWVVGVGFDVARQTSFASVFDGQRLADGPVALAHLPYWTPHCFHGNFYSA
ncbi:carotenoid oxygenase family protein [Burkholderiaceae bacterium DAT-1]|nr:carotenoid oxygenase family protein [Burkholderiaceae bacterium DAT-1]